MAKYSSNRQGRSYTRSSTKQQREDILNMLNEWFALYFEKENNDIQNNDNSYFNKIIIQKYNLMRKFLKSHFLYDAALKDYIKLLPKTWILKKWLIEISCILGWFLVWFGNMHYLKIYTGIILRMRGECDLIEMIVLIIFLFIYCFLGCKKHKTFDNMKYYMLQIMTVLIIIYMIEEGSK